MQAFLSGAVLVLNVLKRGSQEWYLQAQTRDWGGNLA